MVDTNADPAEAAAGRVPVGSEIVPYAPGEGNGAAFEVLRRQVMISGEQLINAQQSYDPQSNQPVVSIRFDSGGSSTLARQSGVLGKSVSGRVDLGGRRILNKKKNIKNI